MTGVHEFVGVMARQALSAAATSAVAAATSMPAEEEEVPPACVADNDYDGRMGVRISAIFVILVGSLFGAVFPVYAARHRGVGVPEWAFFIAKYFGSGVIIATAFIHLLAPANEALGDECLTGSITAYPWPEGIALMTVFVLFFIELMAMRYAVFAPADHPEHHSPSRRNSHAPGENHLSHTHDHTENPDATKSRKFSSDIELANVAGGADTIAAIPVGRINEIEDYAAQLTAIFILEFGVIFHSIFIGLTLAVAGDEFTTLYIVLVFHQTFEGLGLGSRLAATPWPKGHRWTPYWLGAGYSLSTPIAIAAGLGVRMTYAPGTQTALITNGVFDSISAGILIYTGLVELMAHEFMFSQVMRKAKTGVVLAAFGVMCLGAGLMALLGKWA